MPGTSPADPTSSRPTVRLADDAFTGRHRLVCAALALHLPLLGWLGMAVAGQAATRVAVLVGVAAALLLVAVLAPGRHGGPAATAGLLWSSVVLVQFSGGQTEAYFHFFVVVGLVTLYRSWWSMALTAAFVAAAGGAAVLLPEPIFYGLGSAPPLLWTGVHGATALVVGLALGQSWRMTQEALADEPVAASGWPGPITTPAHAHDGHPPVPAPPATEDGDGAWASVPTAPAPPPATVPDGNLPSPPGGHADSGHDDPGVGDDGGERPRRGRRRTPRRRGKTPTTWSLPAPGQPGDDAADADEQAAHAVSGGARTGAPRPAAASSTRSTAASGGRASPPAAEAVPPRYGDKPADTGDDEPDRTGADEAVSATEAEETRHRLSAYQEGMQRARGEIEPAMLRDFLGVGSYEKRGRS